MPRRAKPHGSHSDFSDQDAPHRRHAPIPAPRMTTAGPDKATVQNVPNPPASNPSGSMPSSSDGYSHFLSGGGEMAALMRGKDWSATPLGLPDTWSQSIKRAVSICLNSYSPILLWLGPELRIVYNDAYIPFLGEAKHPAMLAEPGRVAWGEIWPAISPMHDEVLAGRATWVEHYQMFFARRLPREEVYVTFGYSPILGEDNRTVEGVFCACYETTNEVIRERRLSTLSSLCARIPDHRTVEAACRDAARILDLNPLDVPFAVIYLLDGGGLTARRVASTRLADDFAAFPPLHLVGDAAAGDGPGRFGRVAETGRATEVPDLSSQIGQVTTPLWPDLVETALVLPLAAASQARPAGFLIVGVSPRRVLDADYRSFPRPGGPTHCNDPCGCTGVRGRTAAGRSPGRDRPGQDRLLLECEPRVPNPAYPHDGPARGDARQAGG